MTKQRGFSTLLGAGIAFAVIAGLLVIQTKRLETAKVELSTCKDHYNQALASIQKQNESVEVGVKAGAQAKAASEAALKAANASLKASQAEKDRLALHKAKSGACEDAVKVIRQGLSR